MAHVVAEPCINCKYTDCVAVCPVDCFHEGVNFLVIDPETCIDCGLCAGVPHLRDLRRRGPARQVARIHRDQRQVCVRLAGHRVSEGTDA